MIIKQKDSLSAKKLELDILRGYALPENKRWLVEREIRLMRSGEKGEKQSAYYIDAQFGNSDNWAVIHDLRIEIDDFSAQIDHLLINRFLEIYVLESKNFKGGLRIDHYGDFYIRYNGEWKPIESPLAQNARHIQLLRRVIEQYDLAPKRLKVGIPVKFIDLVLVSPSSSIKRPSRQQFDTSKVVHSDRFLEEIVKQDNKSLT